MQRGADMGATVPVNDSEGSDRPYLCLSQFGRSGAVFFHSLFDGHPAFSTIPGIAPYNILAEAAYTKPWNAGTEALTDFIVQKFNTFFHKPYYRNLAGLDRLGPGGDEVAAVDIGAFRAAVADHLARTERLDLLAVSEAMHTGFDRALGLKPKKKVFLQLHTIVPGMSSAIIAALPKRQVVLLAREPVDAVEALVNFFHAPAEAFPTERFAKFYRFLKGMLSFQYGQDFLDEDSIVIRLEDVKSHGEQFLRRFCRQLKLDFHPALLQSTFMNKTYRSVVSRRNPNIQGFEKPNQAPQGYRLSERDRRVFALLFSGIAKYLRYPNETIGGAEEIAAILGGAPLDVEADFSDVAGISIFALQQREEFRSFRAALVSYAAQPGWGNCGLRCDRFLLDAETLS